MPKLDDGFLTLVVLSEVLGVLGTIREADELTTNILKLIDCTVVSLKEYISEHIYVSELAKEDGDNNNTL